MADITQAQQEIIDQYHDEWIEIGMRTEPADRPGMERAIAALYVSENEPVPEFVWVQDPYQANVLINWLLDDAVVAQANKLAYNNDGVGLLRDLALYREEVDDLNHDFIHQHMSPFWGGANLTPLVNKLSGRRLEYINNVFYGQHESYWIAYYLCAQALGVVFDAKDAEALSMWAETAKMGGWWYPYDSHCICVERPAQVCFDMEQNWLHNPEGYAIEYTSGWGVCVYRGRTIDREMEWAIFDHNAITAEHINQEGNVENRRILLELMGGERYFDQVNARLVDSDGDNKVYLYEADTPRGRFQMTLSICHSTGRKFVEFVGDNIFPDVQAAQRWQWQVEHYNPTFQS
jgi:hypothetical protein